MSTGSKRGPRTLLLAAMLGLAACASPSLRAVRQDGRLVPPDVFLTVDDGARLPARFWRPDTAPVAVVLALHGFEDSRDAWEGVGPLLARHGIARLAYPPPGVGPAPRRGHWAGQGRMVDDAADAAAILQRVEPGVPLYLMGESMGGAVLMCLIASDALARQHVAVAGTILLAPAVWGRDDINPLVLAALDGTNMVDPGWQLTGRELPLRIAASDDRAALIRLARDPLTLRAAPISMVEGLVNLMTSAQAAAPRLQGPVLIASGAHDQLVPAAATTHAWRRLPSYDRRAFYANGYHLLLRDLDRQAAEADLVSWITDSDRPLPSGADVLAAARMTERPWLEAR